MHHPFRTALLATASVAAIALTTATSAGAVTITGGGTFTTNAGPSRTVAGSLAVRCATTSTTTTISSGTYTPPTPIGTALLHFSGCNFQSPVVPVTVTCQPLGPAVVNLTGPPSLPAPGVIPWSVTQVDCTIAMTSLPTCRLRLTGETPVLYFNPGTVLGGSFGAFEFQVASESFTVTNTSSPPCGLPTTPMAGYIGSPVGTGLGLADLRHDLTSVGPTVF